MNTRINQQSSSIGDAESPNVPLLSNREQDDLVRVNRNELINHVSHLNIHEIVESK